MESLAQLLFTIGTVVLAIAFAAHIGHAVLLANGRRVVGAVGTLGAQAMQPAWAGVASGSFVESRSAAMAAGPAPFATPSPLSRPALWLAIGAFGTLAASMLLRAAIVGRGPWGNLFEFSVAFAVSILGGYLVLSRRYPIRSIGFIPTGVALALALYASSLPSEVKPLVPALQNAPLLTIHVGMAVLSYGIFATSFAAGVGYLIQGRNDRFSWLPSHRVLDEVAYRAVVIGFPIFATMIILGSWWASIAWSRYWGWDPKETAALVTWLTYAIYLHARNQRAWAGRPAALLLVLAFAMVLVTYSGSLWFNGLHAYSGL
ncbi:MAG TPA: cytochrome c biogenesis protein CcsA [Candidatus Eisenbacteria bacterium]|nr:cytochrome c biogenesis protein CcsA [Candidatus Eisenbacteria bacterium]